MDRGRGTGIAFAVVLILLGAWFLALRLVPGLQQWVDTYLPWPLLVVAGGALLFLIGLLTRTPGLAVPACIVAGIGGVLTWQNASGDWESWSYAWALIPGFVGVGVTLSGLLSGRGMRAVRDGIGLILTSLVLFAVFGGLFGGPPLVTQYWPALLILAGLWILAQVLIRPRRSS
jgi:cytochrome bd-type quinol oxidase subunit 2